MSEVEVSMIEKKRSNEPPLGGWRWGGPKERPNPHISYDNPDRACYKVIADLVAQYGPQEGRLIEVGCGIGQVLEVIARRNPRLRLTCADIDAECVRITSEKVNLESAIVVNPGKDLATEHPGEYDVLVLSHVLEHTSAPGEFLCKHLQLLRVGGIAILAVPNPVRPVVILGNIRRRHYVNRGHVCAWDRSHWMNFLENILELQVVAYASDCVPLGRISCLPGMKAVERWLAKIVPWLSGSNIAVVRN